MQSFSWSYAGMTPTFFPAPASSPMKPMRNRLFLAILAILLATAGCLGAEDPQAIQETANDADPTTELGVLPETITGIEHITRLDEVQAAAGIHVEAPIAYVAGLSHGFYTVNITDPTNPTIEGPLEDEFTRGVDLLHYDDRTIAVAAGQSTGMKFINVTDPTQPTLLSIVLEGESEVHNVITVPDTHLVYNSRSLDVPGVDIVDATNPEEPRVIDQRTDFACHDVRIGPHAERAYCAAITETQIWDITTPEDPSVITRIHNPSINIHHWATVTNEKDILLIGDEFAGSTDAAAGCYAAIDSPVSDRTISDPVGAVWFYDISDETSPTPLSWIAPPIPQDNIPPTPCTAHFGEILTDRGQVIVGWRAAGTVLVDFQDPTEPFIVDTEAALGDNWEAQYEGRYIFAGDTVRGFDVLAFTDA